MRGAGMSTSAPNRRDLGSIARVSPAEANRLVKVGKAVLVDTRDLRYYEEAHAQPAISVPLDEFRGGSPPASLERVGADQIIILYCT
jgi:rhodanese-related sulfurtransferase